MIASILSEAAGILSRAQRSRRSPPRSRRM